VIWFLLGLGLAGGTWALSRGLSLGAQQVDECRWLSGWTLKGVVVPWSLWCLMNLGFTWELPPYLQSIQQALYSGKSWFPLYLKGIGAGWVIIISFWAAVTLTWVLAKTTTQLEGEPLARFKGLCWTAGLGLGLVAVGIYALGGPLSAGFAVLAIVVPIAGYAPGVIVVPKLPPSYARAVAKMKFGKYSDAEQEVLAQLEKAEDDFQGWMMLATLYAEHFNDLPEAEQTILELCDHPSTNASQVSIALHRLADWHLKLKRDPIAARRALQIIFRRYKNTHLARMAQIRISQLPTSREELEQQDEAAPVPLPALGDNLDEHSEPLVAKLPRHRALELANTLSQRLQEDPNLVSVREKFARMLADQLDRPEEAITQLQLLLDMPDQPAEKRALWLSLIAAYHLKHRDDTSAARFVLEQLVREFPKSMEAMAARRRLELMARAAQRS